MNTPMKRFLLGVTLAVVGPLAGQVGTARHAQGVARLYQECLAETARQRGVTDLQRACNPAELAASSGVLVGVQNTLASEERQRRLWQHWSTTLPLATGGALALP